jgi:hypothetical protein
VSSKSTKIEFAESAPFLVVFLEMANTKPYVAAACFCEQILQEPDGVLSAIRIVDTYIIQPVPQGVQVAPDGVVGFIVVKGLISLKSGDLVGNGKVGLILHKPNGEITTLSPEDGWPATLEGGEQGWNAKLNFVVGVKTFGLMWFDVEWNGELLTRIPLRLKQGELLEQAKSES